MREKIALFGAGGHALSCIDIIERENRYKIEYILDKKPNNKVIKKYKIIEENEANIKFLLKKNIKNALISIGQIKSFKIRESIFLKLKKKGFKFPVIKSPTSIVSKNSLISEGSIIFHNVVINSGSRIGKNCIINSLALIEHGALIEDNTHISTGVIINGDCIVRKNSFIGSGAIVKQGVEIKKNSFIKMGSLITK